MYIFIRLVIPIKKILLSEEALAKPIPTLSDRQFVVTQSSLSQTEQHTQRELFWYREELFKIISGRWREVSTLAPLSDLLLLTDVPERLAGRAMGSYLSETRG